MAKTPQKQLPAPVSAAPALPPAQEIATVGRDPFQFPIGGIIQPRDDTLLTRGGSRGIWIYDDIERDTHAYGELQKRKLAVTAREWYVEAASEDAIDKAAAELVERRLKALNFDALSTDLLDATLKGTGIAEVMWAQDGKEIFPRKTIARDQRRFVFDEQAKLRMLTVGNMFKGEEMPDRKFIVHRFGAKDGNPYGLGLGTRLFWPVIFKRQGIKFWLIFAEKFGSPTAVGKYPPGTGDKDQEKLLEALMAIATDAGIIFPAGMEVELLEAARQGNVDTYESLCRYMDEQISGAVLGEAQSARAQGGALAAAAISRNEVRLELVKADADLLSETLNDTLVTWMTEYNFPGARPPKVWRNCKQPEDLDKRAERDSKIARWLGYKPTPEYVTETYGEGWVENKAPKPVLPGRGALDQLAAHDAEAAFAEAVAALFPDQVALDAAVETIPPAELDRRALELLKPVLALIAKSATYDEILERLAATHPQLNTQQLEDLLARALFISDTWGRISARQEIADAGGA